MIIKNEDSLIYTLKALKIIKESKINKKIDLSKIDKITPFFITPITSFLKQNKDFLILKRNMILKLIKSIYQMN